MELRIDRCNFSQIDLKNSHVELHIFPDASPSAYGCVAYFEVTSNDKSCYVNFIVSKARVTPLKELTLPRIELMGALIAVRIAKHVCNLFKEIKLENFYWMDSTIQHCVKGASKPWKPFVKNRVFEIPELSQPENWSYCNTKDNLADLVTRGASTKMLMDNKL